MRIGCWDGQKSEEEREILGTWLERSKGFRGVMAGLHVEDHSWVSNSIGERKSLRDCREREKERSLVKY